MILQCPKCSIKFSVDAVLIPAEGRDVKCSKCAHIWHVAGTSSLDILDDVFDTPKDIEEVKSDVKAEEDVALSNKEESIEDIIEETIEET